MPIKLQDFNFKPSTKAFAVYVLTGEEPYLLQQTALALKAQFKQAHHDVDECIMDLDTQTQWNTLSDQANTFNLFASHTLIDARFDKKSLDQPAKQFFETYLKSPNPHCRIVFRAPQLNTKHAQSLESYANLCLITIKQPAPAIVQRWIANALKKNHLAYEHGVPELLSQYTHGNLLACAQALEKIVLTASPLAQLTCKALQNELYNQSDYQLYELTDACLSGQSAQAITILRQALEQKQEATLILWVLAQETRLLLHMAQQLKKGMPLQHAIAPLNIWSSKVSLYQKACQRQTVEGLKKLLQCCAKVDVALKTGTPFADIQRTFEHIIIGLSTGEAVIA